MFAHKRRQERKPCPGDLVGQSLVTCTPQDTFSTVSAHPGLKADSRPDSSMTMFLLMLLCQRFLTNHGSWQNVTGSNRALTNIVMSGCIIV